MGFLLADKEAYDGWGCNAVTSLIWINGVDEFIKIYINQMVISNPIVIK